MQTELNDTYGTTGTGRSKYQLLFENLIRNACMHITFGKQVALKETSRELRMITSCGKRVEKASIIHVLPLYAECGVWECKRVGAWAL
jgi:hypothetical protein